MANVLRYWHAIEMFDPQGIPALLSRRDLAAREPGSRCVEAVPFLAGEPVSKLPWQEGHLRYEEPPKDATYGSEWRYTVYGGVFSFGAVRKVLAERLGFTEPEDFAGTRKEDTESALFAFTVDQRGLLLDGTGALSSCAWASGRLDGVRRGQRTALEGFEKVSGECQDAMERLLAKPVQYPRSLPARVAGVRQEGREAKLHQKNGDGWLASVADVLGGAAEGAVAAVLAALTPGLGALGAGALTGAANAAITTAVARAKRAVGSAADSSAADSGASAPAQADGAREASDKRAGGLESPPASDGPRPIEAFDIAWFGAVVADILKLPPTLRNYLSVRVVSYPVEKRWDGSLPDPEPVFLSSMIAPDLERVADTAVHGYGEALRSYLSEPVPAGQRVDLRAPGIRPQLLKRVAPACCPPGRWPAAPAMALVLSQQFAVNTIIAQLVGRSGLFAVNGPPGTGKTTLLRDLVTAIVVTRAAEMAKLKRPSQAFVRRARIPAKNDTYQRVLGPCDELTGFEIVVASSNNAAVENVTRELPARRALGDPWQAKADYFADQALQLMRKKQRDDDQEAGQEPGQEADPAQDPARPNLELDPARSALEEAWGLVAVPLGNSKNRKRFCGWFWRARTGLRAHLESLQANGCGQAEWDGARQRFEDALRKAEALAPRRAALDPATWDALPQSEQEQTPLWPDDDWLAARAEVFLAALDLHRALVTALAKTFKTNLELLARTLAREPGAPPSDAEYAAWQTLFLLIPVVSTTFASCGRLFASLGCESLGWALIDEAGQALPQAAVGTLWRVERAVVVGDPRQLQPISQVPAEVQEKLAHSFGVSDALWRPADGSTQTLADRRSVLGTTVPTTSEPVWVGAPLRVHRRCEQPMFDMSNALAYGGMMVYGTRREQFPARPRDAYPGSCWIDVKQRDGTGKWVPAQGEALLRVLQKLRGARFGVGLEQVYVLSPFRDVVTECRKKIGTALRDELVPGRTRVSFTKEHIGTVHSMQGREADVVIFILGTDRSASGRARRWVGNPPNLLNVAVSRAKRRLFVIGCFSEWTDVPSFSVFDDPARFPRVRFA